MKLFVVRHGETRENVLGILQGQGSNRLSTNGLKQAQLVAERLKKESFDVIYSSDLARAVETTNEIIKFHSKTQIKYDKDLRERDVGSWVGKKMTDVDWINLPSDIESKEQIKERVINFFKKIAREHNNKNVLLVSHGMITRGLISHLLNKQYREIEKSKNTGLSIIELKNGEVIPHLLNCTKHLE